MASKIFVSYRRDDGAASAARLRDRLSAAFGAGNVFMDVDDLLVGQRFDKELEKVLAQTDVFLAVIGPHWLEILKERLTGKTHDYVQAEIAAALARNIIVIPVLVERATLPNDDALPENIRELVLHQKYEIAHERFGRDVEDLVAQIRTCRRMMGTAPAGTWSSLRVVGAGLAALIFGGGVLAYQMGVPIANVAGWSVDATQQVERGAERVDTDHKRAEAEAALRQAHTYAMAVANEGAAKQRAAQLLTDGEHAIRRGDRAAMTRTSADLAALGEELIREYTLTIVSRPGESSGVWRRPPGDGQARNYYLIVEPLAPDGTRVSIPVRNEETGAVETVSKFGVRVPEQTYQTVVQDKADDGIVQKNRFGVKRRGTLAVDYLMPFDGGSITKW